MRRTAALVVAAGVATLVPVGGSLTVGALTFQENLPEELRVGPLWFVIPLYPLVVAGVGVLVAYRRPANSIGWLMCATAVMGGLVELGQFDSYYSLAGGRPGPVPVEMVAWLGRVMWLPWLTLQLVFLPVFFPDGSLPSRRWAWLLWPAGLIALVGTASRALTPGLLADVRLHNPFAVTDPHGLLHSLAVVAALALTVMAPASLASVFFRLRTATGDRRQQLKWFGTAVALLVAATAGGWIVDDHFELDSPLLEVLFPSVYLTIPIAIGISVLRYRLYDIDLVINRTLVYGSLALFISAVYLVVVIGIGALVGMHDHVTLLPLAAAGMVALAFQPLRARLQRVANRFVYGRRSSPYDALAALSRRASETAPSEQILTDTMRALCRAIGLRVASVWLDGGRQRRLVAQWPSDGDSAGAPWAGVGQTGVREFPIHNGGALLGTIRVSLGPGRSLSAADERLLADVASQAGLLFQNLGLAADLVARVVELQESRRRLVNAQEDERRRIERNLHDGAQQEIFGLRVNIRQLRNLWQRDPGAIQAALVDLEADAEKALSTVKELARGVYPPLLTTQGLVGALSARARSAPVAVRISNHGVGRYSADVEEAVYFACSEALQNAVKHAEAATVRIILAEREGELTFQILDDGRGFDVTLTTDGAGLRGLRDRLDVVGGSVSVVSRPGGGTTVSGRLPVEPGDFGPLAGSGKPGREGGSERESGQSRAAALAARE